VARQHPDLTGVTRNDHHLGLAVECRAGGRDERERELGMLSHYVYAATGSSCIDFARSTASSIVPTM
jgi:hypothetical protein